ncbi:MAG: nitroreductase family protein [Pseudomonadota bacterium]
MPEPRSEVVDFLLTRRSRPAKTLSAPAPDAAALEPILTAALRVPDHGKLEPWSLVVVEGAALARLAQLARDSAAPAGRDAEAGEKAAAMFANAPLIVAVLSTPVDSAKIPEVEQTLSAGAVCLGLVNAALASGWGANWLTGWPALDPGFLRAAFDLQPPGFAAGFIVLGSETVAPPERPRPDPALKVRRLTA